MKYYWHQNVPRNIGIAASVSDFDGGAEMSNGHFGTNAVIS